MSRKAAPFPNAHGPLSLRLAEKYDLKKADAKRTIDVVRTVMGTFPEIAERNEVPEEWIDKIDAYLKN